MYRVADDKGPLSNADGVATADLGQLGVTRTTTTPTHFGSSFQETSACWQTTSCGFLCVVLLVRGGMEWGADRQRFLLGLLYAMAILFFSFYALVIVFLLAFLRSRFNCFSYGR